MGTSKLLVFLIGIHFSSGKIHTIDVDYNDFASGKLSMFFLVDSQRFYVAKLVMQRYH